VAHLNSLWNDYRDKGFNVIAISNEKKLVIERFMHQIDPRMSYPIAVGGGADYEVTGIPAAYLIGGDGKVVWEGSPGSLSDKLIEENLRKLPRWSKLGGAKAQAAGKELDKDDFGKAYQLASELVKADGVAKEDAEAAQKMVEHIKKAGNRRLKYADTLVAGGETSDALAVLEGMTKEFAGTEWAEKAAEKRKTLAESESVKAQLETEQAVAKVLKRIKGNLGDKECESFKKTFEKMIGDTKGSAQVYLKHYVEVFSEKWVAKRE